MSSPYGSAPVGYQGSEPPPSNLVWGILVLVFCGGGLAGLVGGIVSIVYATQVNGRWAAGDMAGAAESSRKARQWALWGAVISVVIAVLIVIAVVALGGLAALSDSGTG